MLGGGYKSGVVVNPGCADRSAGLKGFVVRVELRMRVDMGVLMEETQSVGCSPDPYWSAKIY